MAIIENQYRTRAFIGGVEVMLGGEVVINESLDSLCRVAEFEIGEQPASTPVEGDAVAIVWQRYNSESDGDQWALFSGKINTVEVNSQPWSLIVRCTDQLELLRRVPGADHDLTGLTEGEAVMEVLDSCQIDYDPAEICDSGYILGAMQDVVWPKGVTGAQMLQEIDYVFGCVTMTIADDMVIRIRVDQPPLDSVGQYRTLERGVDYDFESHVRRHGDRDAIQNYWSVRGVSAECGTDGSCTCTPWANAVDGNPQLGSRRVRVTEASFSSDLIQSEALAEHIVRRQMRLTNRLSENATIVTTNDPNVHPGTKLGLIDDTYGITTGAVRNATVTAVDRTGATMSLEVISGAPGEEGTVTHGVDRVCNDVHTDTEGPGDFDPPEFDFPPVDPPSFVLPVFDIFLPGLYDIGGTTDAVGDYPVGVAIAAEWANDPNPPGEDWAIAGSTITAPTSANGVAVTTNPLLPERSAGVPKAHKVEFSVFVSDATANVELFAEDEAFNAHWWFAYFNGSVEVYFMAGCYYNGTCGVAEYDFGSLTPGATVAVTIEWDPDAVAYTVQVGAVTQVVSAADSGVGGPILFSAISSNGATGTCQVSNFEITVLE